jgi:hypothetical protein
MFWDKKDEKRSLPDLPPIQSPFSKDLALPKINTEDDFDHLEPVEKHNLPSFPDSPINKGFSQAVIKDAVNPPEYSESQEIIGDPIDQERRFKTIEMDNMENKNETLPSIASSQRQYQPKPLPTLKSNSQVQNQQESSLSLGLPPPLPLPVHSINQIKMPPTLSNQKNQDIFVKIDKFQSARKALNSAKEQLEEINNLLRKIRETKLREEQELSSWEKDLSAAKARIQEITENIFEKIT